MKATDFLRLRKATAISYALLFTLAIAAFAAGILHRPDGFESADTPSYIRASYRLMAGEIDALRTPVYPFIIALVRSLAGTELLNRSIVILQCGVYLLSAFFLMLTLRNLKVNQWITLIATAIYALFPGFYIFCFILNTEAFAQSFVVFFGWSMLRDAGRTPRISSALLSGTWLFILIFLRPAMICLIPVYIIYWAALYFKFRRGALKSCAAALCCLLMLGVAISCYKGAVKAKCGVSTISVVAAVNNYYLVRETKILRPHHTGNPAFQAMLHERADSIIITDDGWVDFHEAEYLLATLRVPPADVSDAVNAAIKENPGACLRLMPVRFRRACCSYTVLPVPPRIAPYFPMRMLWYWLLMGASLVWLILRRSSMQLWVLWLTSAAISACAILGAMNDWCRLSLPAMSMALMLAAVICSRIKAKLCG